jgi:molybdate transport system permease protein
VDLPGLSAAESQAVLLSGLVAITAVAVSLPFGILAGWALGRRDFPGKAVAETVINLPLVLPPVVTGYLLLVTFGRRSPVGAFLDRTLGIEIVFDWKGAALASAVMAFPLMVRAIRLSFASIDPDLEQAARTLGAGPIDAFFTVSLPLARRGIIAGSVLGFARSLGEFGATIMIAGSIPGETRTIPLHIYALLDAPGGMEAAGRLVAVSIFIAAGALLAGEALERSARRKLHR